MTLRALSGVLSRQALVVGRIHDALRGTAPADVASLTVAFRKGGGAGAFLPFPEAPRLLDGMYYACAGAPEAVLSDLGPADGLDLRVTVEAPSYQAATVEATLPPTALGSVDEPATVGGIDTVLRRWPGLPAVVDVPLQPLPVALEGRVIDDHDPAQPVVGATARVTAPESRGPVTTDARGAFRIENLPVALAVTVEIALGPRTLTAEVEVEPDVPMNQRTFSLPA